MEYIYCMSLIIKLKIHTIFTNCMNRNIQLQELIQYNIFSQIHYTEGTNFIIIFIMNKQILCFTPKTYIGL